MVVLNWSVSSHRCIYCSMHFKKLMRGGRREIPPLPMLEEFAIFKFHCTTHCAATTVLRCVHMYGFLYIPWSPRSRFRSLIVVPKMGVPNHLPGEENPQGRPTGGGRDRRQPGGGWQPSLLKPGCGCQIFYRIECPKWVPILCPKMKNDCFGQKETSNQKVA